MLVLNDAYIQPTDSGQKKNLIFGCVRDFGVVQSGTHKQEKCWNGKWW